MLVVVFSGVFTTVNLYELLKEICFLNYKKRVSKLSSKVF